MRDDWSFEDLVESWTLVAADWVLVANRAGPTRLGFALSLEFFELEARFAFAAAEFASSVVEFVAVQVKVAAERLVDYDWDSRSATHHRAQIRESFGFRVCTRADEIDFGCVARSRGVSHRQPTRHLARSSATRVPSSSA